MKYRSDIDGLRTVAVLPVVLYHANVAGFSGGFIGVDVFFVISGYLITSIIHNELTENRFSIVQFYERRARRILPALFCVLLASLFAGWFLLSPGDYEYTGKSTLSALLFSSNIWFWKSSGGYFQGATDYLPLLHTWSLAVEEQFYIFFPVLLAFLHRIGKRFLLPVTCIVFLLSFILSIWATQKFPSASFYLLPTRIWELGIGSLLALGMTHRQFSRIPREALATAGFLAIILPVFLYNSDISFPGWSAIPPVIGAAAIILAGSSGKTFISELLSSRPIVFVGLLSYSLYLWHWPIMAFSRNWLISVELPLQWQIGTISLSFIAAWLSWRLIENPFRKPQKIGGFSRGQIFFGSATGIFFISVLAAAIVLTSGAKNQRFTDAQLNRVKTIVRYEPGKGCFNAFNVDKLCSFGAQKDTPTWLLWGDSHARHLLPAISAIAERQGRTLLFAGSSTCPPLLGIYQWDSGKRDFERCANFREAVMQRIEASHSLETIIIAARWPVYVEGQRMPSEKKGTLVLYPEDGSTNATFNDTSMNAAMVKQGLATVRDRTVASGKRMIVIGAAPEIPWDVAAWFKAAVFFNRPLPENPNISQILDRQHQTNEILKSVTDTPGVSLIPLAEGICKPTCPTYDDDAVFYHDNSHFTPSGARQLVEPLLNDVLSENINNFDSTE